MDPDEFLRLAVKDVLNGDYTQAFQRIEDYEAWTGKGGFLADPRLVEWVNVSKEFQREIDDALKEAHESPEKRSATIPVSEALRLAESDGFSRSAAIEYIEKLIGSDGLQKSSELSVGELLHCWEHSEWTERVWLHSLLVNCSVG